MKNLFFILLLGLFPFLSISQIDTISQKMVSMDDTRQKPYKVGTVYYENGESEPYDGVLYGKYKNGNYLSIQEYKNGIGNGNWINYYEDGTLKEVGTYVDNRVEGPIKKYHNNGTLAEEGIYEHWRLKVGIWKYYDRNGNLIKTINHSK